MKEQLISFETAKLAKEKGCIIKSNLSYNSIGNLESYRSINFYTPTQSLLQKWLRDVHSIHIYCERVEYLDDNEPSGYKWVIFNNINSGLDIYTTYEEALEKGLQEALKTIRDEI